MVVGGKATCAPKQWVSTLWLVIDDASVAPGVCIIVFFCFFFVFFCTDMICRFYIANLLLHMFRGVSETIQGMVASD